LINRIDPENKIEEGGYTSEWERSTSQVKDEFDDEAGDEDGDEE